MTFKKTMIKRISALVMVLIISMSCALPAFADVVRSDKDYFYDYYPECGAYTYSTGNLPFVGTSDISAYFSSYPNPSILFNTLHSYYNNNNYADVSIYPDYIVYISTWGRASVVFFDYRNPRWSKVTLNNNVLHFEGMEQKNYHIISGMYCNDSPSDSFGIHSHSGSIYAVQNIQYGQTKSLDNNFSGNINDNVYGSNCVTVISSTVTIYTSDDEIAFEPPEPDGTIEDFEPSTPDEFPDSSDMPELSPPEPQEWTENAPNATDYWDSDNPIRSLYDLITNFFPDLLRWFAGFINVHIDNVYRVISYYITTGIRQMLQYIRGLFAVLSNRLESALSTLTHSVLLYSNAIINRMNFLNAKLLTALNDLKGINENGFEAVSDALSHLQLSYNDTVTNTEINNDFSTVNNKLETVNTSIQDLSDLFKPSDGSAPATNIWDFLSTVVETLGGMVGDLADASSDIMRTLGDVIKSCFDNLIELLKQMLDLLFVPDKDNLHDIVENNSPAIAQLSDLRSRFSVSTVNASNIQVSHFEVPVTTVNGDADLVTHINADGETSGTINLSFDLSQIPDSIKNPLHTMSTIILYVVQIFVTIRAFFKLFGVNVGGSDE